MMQYLDSLHAAPSGAEYDVHGGRRACRLVKPSSIPPHILVALHVEFGPTICSYLGPDAQLVDVTRVHSKPGAKPDCHRDILQGRGIVVQVVVGRDMPTTRGIPGSADRGVKGEKLNTSSFATLAVAGTTTLVLDAALIHGACANETTGWAGLGRTWLTFMSKRPSDRHLLGDWTAACLEVNASTSSGHQHVELNEIAKAHALQLLKECDEWVCRSCEKRYDSRDALRKHLREKHAGVLTALAQPAQPRRRGPGVLTAPPQLPRGTKRGRE